MCYGKELGGPLLHACDHIFYTHTIPTPPLQKKKKNSILLPQKSHTQNQDTSFAQCKTSASFLQSILPGNSKLQAPLEQLNLHRIE